MKILGFLGEPSFLRSDGRDLRSEWDAGWYHNSAAVLVDDGRVVAGGEEERFTRRKHSGKFPYDAIAFCLADQQLAIDDIDLFAFGERGGDGELRDPRISTRRIADVLRHGFPGAADLEPRVRLVEHHVGHAMSAFGPSGFDAALVMTSDGFGDGIAGCVMTARANRLDATLTTFAFANSLGRFYSSVLGFLGFGPGDEYKVMGLAPYGDPTRLASFLEEQYTLLPAGGYAIVNHDWREMSRRLSALGRPRVDGDAFTDFQCDVAAAVQAAYERMVFHVLTHYRQVSGLRDLCLAGGTAQNSSCNGKLLASGLFDRIFVQPAAHDAGIALGAALHVQADEGRSSTFRGPAHMYWGTPIPDDGDLRRELGAWGEFVEFEHTNRVAEVTAEHLASGKIVAWVQGRSEFGPRALGNRSILADPRPQEHKALINAKIKNREAYRPFAPAVVVEKASRYFHVRDAQSAMPFMTFVTQVRDEQRGCLDAITHVDGSARIQTVSREDNARFWALIDAFGQRTGVFVLLNTSFNNNCEPIVDTATQALACFLTTGLDLLVVGDFIVRKKPIATAAAYLNLVASIRTDVLLARYRERQGRARGRAAFGLIRRGFKEEPVSPLAYAILSRDESEVKAIDLLSEREREEGDLNALGLELHQLWSKRLIDLRP
ncbi:carbamoyltransferase [Burkholderia sp. NLJ2]|uniref:carbamoyltransferase family protein n=1 Tax=Burkholderia sp. NLJ2 TaxID=3090699 RepID=UPI003C6C008A